MPPAIQAQRLFKESDQETDVLNGLTFEVPPAATYVLLGPSGSGTSTLVGVLRSAIQPTSGQALIGGKNCTTDRLAVRREAVFSTRKASLFPSMSARSNVKYFCRLAGVSRSIDDTAIENAFRRVGFPERAFDRRLHELGRTGHVQAWLALALLRGVRALILEDPTHAIDQTGQRSILEGIQECRDAGAAVLIGTSNIAFASAAGDIIGVLEGGTIQSEHSGAEFRQQGLAELLKHGLGFVNRNTRA